MAWILTWGKDSEQAKALREAQELFLRTPGATNWNQTTDAMLAYQKEFFDVQGGLTKQEREVVARARKAR